MTEHTLEENHLYLKRMGIHSHQESVVYMRDDCHVCHAEGFNAHSRVQVRLLDAANPRSIVATLSVVSANFLSHREIGLSDSAWQLLGGEEGMPVSVTHAKPAESMSAVRGKIYGTPFSTQATHAIISDITQGIYSDIQLAAFVTACSGSRLNTEEVIALTRAMVDVGDRLNWGHAPIMDKHCVGGLPGNRTTPIVVAIVAAAGLVMPKTSSRAITSPAGTADTLATLTRVDLDDKAMRRVVEQEGGCMVWGGAVSLSPADDILIRIERALDLDSEGQLVASVLSKKAAAGATHVLVDIPVGITAKVRSQAFADRLSEQLIATGRALGLQVVCHLSDGSQPVGHGIGPALEARDLLAVLKNAPHAPADLRARSLALAAILLEMGKKAPAHQGFSLAQSILDSGAAWQKFQAICLAQGGLFEPPQALYQHAVTATHAGIVTYINNRVLGKLAKLAGAPASPAAGVDFHVKLGQKIQLDTPLFTLHAETPGELNYALDFLATHPDLLKIEEDSL